MEREIHCTLTEGKIKGKYKGQPIEIDIKGPTYVLLYRKNDLDEPVQRTG